MSRLHELNQHGQSMWYDNMRRALLEHGELQRLIDDGVTGVTSNPTIFEKAIVGSADYDETLRQLAADTSAGEIYETLALEDIRRTADMLRPIYESTDGADGYVSLEVSPKLARDTEGTIAEARRLYAALERPNVMIKIPATPEGIPAIAQSIGAGININVTLIFSLAQYEAVANAYLEGLETLAAAGGDLSKIASVASFFVSRVDGMVDKELEQRGNTELQGQIAIANAKVAYARFKEIFGDDRFQQLADQGARVQRPLWASTGVKNPSYPDTLYVDTLIGPNTVSTSPPPTISAFLDHGTVANTLEQEVVRAHQQIASLRDLGIDLDAITQTLQDKGVDSFAQSFESLMEGIERKRQHILADQQPYSASLGGVQEHVDFALRDLRDEQVLRRIWAHDHTVWKDEPTEITNRLGWLHMPEMMPDALDEINALVEEVRGAGYTHALLLGMGGSSLAPEVFRLTFGVREGYLDLAVLDSTDPGAVHAHAERLDPARTLFLVSTKSGGTVETFSFFKFFYNWVADKLGAERAGEHFIAITDPGSGLVDTATTYNFRKIFLNDPHIGGRYSALSHFGLVPAALIGVDVALLLERTQAMAVNCASANCPSGGDNAGAWLGAIMGEMAIHGRNKLTMFISPEVDSFGTWAEQLIAESTGKEGVGILPVADEPPGAPEVYGNDRLFVYLRLGSDTTYNDTMRALREAGQPVVQINMDDCYDLGSEFFRWEMATVISGRRLQINPFDQPDVESAKVLARKMVAAYQEEGKLPEVAPVLEMGGITVCGDVHAEQIERVLPNFLSNCQPGSYIALQAYINPTAEANEVLQRLRTSLRDTYRVATTVGYGPRFLHSTGQLHKGDAGRGYFVQITDSAGPEVPIPDTAGKPESSMSFGVLKASQALGDRQALENAGRRIVRFDLGQDVMEGLRKIGKDA
jgi:transaldolase/glucose-6-phosphate isomerase